MSYAAIVTRIQTRPFPGADRLLLGLAAGSQVVVGLDTQDGQLGVYFPCDGQLSEAFAAKHDLVGRTNPETGKHEGGFFAANRRIRSQKFRGEKSDGFWVPLSFLEPWGDTSSLREGDLLTEFHGEPIVSKYFTPATLRSLRERGQRAKKHENRYFAQHSETAQFYSVLRSIPVGTIVYPSAKMHGTSHRLGHVLDEVNLRWYQRWLNRIAPWYQTQRYEYLNGSRRVILEKRGDSHPLAGGYYGTDSFRYQATAGIKLHHGEILYGEIVGWVAPGSPIMPPHDYTKLKDKAATKRFGTKAWFKYGQVEGTCQFYVYRATLTTDDAHTVEYTWPQVKARCGELGLKHVWEIGKPFIYDGNAEALSSYVESIVGIDGGYPPDPIDPTHPLEGVVLRLEKPDGTVSWCKLKSWVFKLGEGLVVEDDNYVDREDAA